MQNFYRQLLSGFLFSTPILTSSHLLAHVCVPDTTLEVSAGENQISGKHHLVIPGKGGKESRNTEAPLNTETGETPPHQKLSKDPPFENNSFLNGEAIPASAPPDDEILVQDLSSPTIVFEDGYMADNEEDITATCGLSTKHRPSRISRKESEKRRDRRLLETVLSPTPSLALPDPRERFEQDFAQEESSHTEWTDSLVSLSREESQDLDLPSTQELTERDEQMGFISGGDGFIDDDLFQHTKHFGGHSSNSSETQSLQKEIAALTIDSANQLLRHHSRDGEDSELHLVHLHDSFFNHSLNDSEVQLSPSESEFSDTELFSNAEDPTEEPLRAQGTSTPIEESSMDLTATHPTSFNTPYHYVFTTCDDGFVGSAGSEMTLADGSTVTTETPATTETPTGDRGDISPQTNDSFSMADTNGGMTDALTGGDTPTAGDTPTGGDSVEGIAAVSTADSTPAEPMTPIETPASPTPEIP